MFKFRFFNKTTSIGDLGTIPEEDITSPNTSRAHGNLVELPTQHITSPNTSRVAGDLVELPAESIDRRDLNEALRNLQQYGRPSKKRAQGVGEGNGSIEEEESDQEPPRKKTKSTGVELRRGI